MEEKKCSCQGKGYYWEDIGFGFQTVFCGCLSDEEMKALSNERMQNLKMKLEQMGMNSSEKTSAEIIYSM